MPGKRECHPEYCLPYRHRRNYGTAAHCDPNPGAAVLPRHQRSTCAAAKLTNTRFSKLWKTMNGASSWTRANTMFDTNHMSSTGPITSNRYCNYNALFVTWRARDYRGESIISYLTWVRALGTTAVTQ